MRLRILIKRTVVFRGVLIRDRGFKSASGSGPGGSKSAGVGGGGGANPLLHRRCRSQGSSPVKA